MSDPSIIKNLSITRVTLTNANQEYTQALSARPVRITVSSDDLTSQILFSLTSGASGTGKRIFQGAEYTSPGFIFGETKSIYLQTPNAGAIAVLEQWEAA